MLLRVRVFHFEDFVIQGFVTEWAILKNSKIYCKCMNELHAIVDKQKNSSQLPQLPLIKNFVYRSFGEHLQFCVINPVCNEILKAEFVVPTLMIIVVLANALPSFSPMSPPDFVTSGVRRIASVVRARFAWGFVFFMLTSFGRKRGDVMKLPKQFDLEIFITSKSNQLDVVQQSKRTQICLQYQVKYYKRRKKDVLSLFVNRTSRRRDGSWIRSCLLSRAGHGFLTVSMVFKKLLVNSVSRASEAEVRQ